MSPHLARGILLFEQRRYELAESEFRLALADHPDDGLAMSQLALCLIERGRPDDATTAAQSAIAMDPESPWPHYALARACLARDDHKAAEAAINESIRLDPMDPDYFSMRAVIQGQIGQWASALESADEGLSLDPSHIGCVNTRALALVQLGRKDEAAAALDGTLSLDPENAFSHANQGWTHLHRNDVNRAIEHFQEALRIDPELDWARAGLVEALKAKNPIYRGLLRFFLWMSRLSGMAQTIVLVAFVFGRIILAEVYRQMPALGPVLVPILVLTFGFIYLTWVASALFNLALRVHPLGRHALTGEQRTASNWVGACLLGALLSAIIWGLGAWRGSSVEILGMSAMVFFLVMMVPIAAIFSCARGRNRLLMTLYTLGLAVIGALMIYHTVLALLDPANLRDHVERSLVFLRNLIMGGVLSTWVAAFLARRT
jgi:Flp pilus assembly protein TadD